MQSGGRTCSLKAQASRQLGKAALGPKFLSFFLHFTCQQAAARQILVAIAGYVLA